MKTGMFVWGIAQDYPAAGGPPPDDTQLPISFAFVKALDGATFMGGNIDPSPVAIESPQGAARVAATYAAQQIGMVPWGVHQGTSPQLEGARIGATAAAVQGCYMIDLEDGPGYWSGDHQAVIDLVTAGMGAGLRELWLCLDSREQHLAGEQFEVWRQSPIVTRYWPQVYWTDFQHTVEQAMAECFQPLTSRGIPFTSIWPVFPAAAPWPELVRAIAMASAAGCPGFALWRRGTLTAENARELAALPSAGEATPPPAPAAPPADTEPATPADSTEAPAPVNVAMHREADAYARGWSDAIATVAGALKPIPPQPANNPYA